MAPGELDVPVGQCSHDSFGGTLPIDPAGHAVNPDSSNASILDPFGTTNEDNPPRVTIDPGWARSQDAFFGSG